MDKTIDRKKVQKDLLEFLDSEIEKHGRDYVFAKSPCVGKCTWTLGKIRDSVEIDTPAEGCMTNLIDDQIALIKYEAEHMSGRQ